MALVKDALLVGLGLAGGVFFYSRSRVVRFVPYYCGRVTILKSSRPSQPRAARPGVAAVNMTVCVIFTG
jgi:hypothetical protein